MRSWCDQDMPYAARTFQLRVDVLLMGLQTAHKTDTIRDRCLRKLKLHRHVPSIWAISIGEG